MGAEVVVSAAAATSADTSGGAEWVTIAEPRRRFDLLELQDGQAIVVGEGDVPPAQYAAVRLVIDTDSSGIRMNDGSAALVNWQGDGEQTLYALVEQPLALWEPGTNLDVIIDFDVGRSFMPLDSAPPTFLFIPWIRAVNEAGTGVLAGRVRGADAPSEVLEPVPNASFTVYRYMPEWYGPMPGYVAATGRTDAEGRYAIHYLSGGEYVLAVHPPAGFAAGVALTGVATVTMGETTTLDVTLPQGGPGGEMLYLSRPSSVQRHDTAYYYANVFGQGGDSVINPAVTWANRNPAVGTLLAPGDRALHPSGDAFGADRADYGGPAGRSEPLPGGPAEPQVDCGGGDRGMLALGWKGFDLGRTVRAPAHERVEQCSDFAARLTLLAKGAHRGRPFHCHSDRDYRPQTCERRVVR